jgi:hypothetical protein
VPDAFVNRGEPDPALVQATADLLAARVELYKVQPNHRLVPLADKALEYLLSPRLLVTLPEDPDA